MGLPKHLPCPCHSNKTYGSCCSPYHRGKAAPTPLALMRSRYSAYALNLADYIQETTHRQSPHYREDREHWREEILTFCRQTQFVGLKILEEQENRVTFRAELTQSGQDASFTQRGEFQKEGEWWFYVKA